MDLDKSMILSVNSEGFGNGVCESTRTSEERYTTRATAETEVEVVIAGDEKRSGDWSS
jgi:hypothetical protein